MRHEYTYRAGVPTPEVKLLNGALLKLPSGLVMKIETKPDTQIMKLANHTEKIRKLGDRIEVSLRYQAAPDGESETGGVKMVSPAEEIFAQIAAAGTVEFSANGAPPFVVCKPTLGIIWERGKSRTPPGHFQKLLSTGYVDFVELRDAWAL